MKIKTDEHQGICKIHYNQGVRMTDFESSSSSQKQQQQHEPIFEKSSEHHRITIAQRYSVITLHLLNYTNENIASLINCHIKSVRRWIHHFEATGEFSEEAVQDLQREGNTHTLTHSFTHSLTIICMYVLLDRSCMGDSWCE